MRRASPSDDIDPRSMGNPGTIDGDICEGYPATALPAGSVARETTNVPASAPTSGSEVAPASTVEEVALQDFGVPSMTRSTKSAASRAVARREGANCRALQEQILNPRATPTAGPPEEVSFQEGWADPLCAWHLMCMRGERIGLEQRQGSATAGTKFDLAFYTVRTCDWGRIATSTRWS